MSRDVTLRNTSPINYRESQMIKQPKSIRNLLLVIAVFTVASCAPGSASNEQTTDTSSRFVATLVGGETFDSNEILATNPLALWFWAPG